MGAGTVRAQQYFCALPLFCCWMMPQDSWLPDPRFIIYLKGVHKLKHGSDSETYDEQVVRVRPPTSTRLRPPAWTPWWGAGSGGR